jgi:hypothetical protein
MSVLYRTHGYALSGAVTRPFNEQIDVQAGLMGHGDGGHSTAQAEKFNHRNLVRFETAVGHSAGSHDPAANRHSSVASMTVEKLNILNMVTVEKVVSRINCNHAFNGKKSTEAEMLPFGSHIEGFKIGGFPVIFQLDHALLSTCATWKDIVAHCKPTPAPAPGTTFVCTLVKSVQYDCPGVTWDSKTGVLVVPDFGKIYVGMLACDSCKRRLTMLHFELGSAVQLTSRVGVVESNNVIPCPPC